MEIWSIRLLSLREKKKRKKKEKNAKKTWKIDNIWFTCEKKYVFRGGIRDIM